MRSGTKKVTRSAGSGKFVPKAEAVEKPAETVVDEVPVRSAPAYDITSRENLEQIIVAAEDYAQLVKDRVNPTNIFALRYLALAEQAKEIIKLMEDRGHCGLPTEAIG